MSEYVRILAIYGAVQELGRYKPGEMYVLMLTVLFAGHLYIY